jgi:hypothetical protein
MRSPILSVVFPILSSVAYSQTLTDVASRRGGLPVEGNGPSNQAQMLYYGQGIVFASGATNLLPGDTNGVSDVYLRRFDQDSLVLISQSSSGEQGNGASERPFTSYDYGTPMVVFESDATNLVSDDTNGVRDIFLRRTLGGQSTTVRLSLGPNGQGNLASRNARISRNGGVAAFESDAWSLAPFDGNGTSDVYAVSINNSPNTPHSAYLVSRNPQGNAGNAASFAPSVADNGAVAFESLATDLIAGDTNGKRDIFCTQGGLQRISIATGGTQANGDSWGASISSDARYVAFVSDATNLVPNDTNGFADVFIRDLQLQTTSIESLSTLRELGNQASGQAFLSPNGRFLVFRSAATNFADGDTNSAEDIFLRDRLTGFLRRVSLTFLGQQSNGASDLPSVSEDGRFIGFASTATNLESGDQNALQDVFVYDVSANSTLRASTTVAGSRTNSAEASLSADGRYVAFTATDALVANDTNGIQDIFVRDRETGAISRASVTTGGGQINNGTSDQPYMTADARYVTFRSSGTVTGWGNSGDQIYLHDLQTLTTTMVSIPPPSTSYLTSCSFPMTTPDARYVVFAASGSNIGQSQIILRDRLVGTTQVLTVTQPGGWIGAGYSTRPRITPDARYVVFESTATSFTPNATTSNPSIYRLDRATGTIEMVAAGTANFFCVEASISDDGRRIAFRTDQSLVPEDTAGNDIYVKDMLLGTFTLVSANINGLSIAAGAPFNHEAIIRGDGTEVAFVGEADDLVPGIVTRASRVYVRNLVTGITRLESVSNGGIPNDYGAGAPTFSADGSVLAFRCSAPNLLPLDFNSTEIFLRDSTPALNFVYCAAKVNSQGCAPRIEGAGTPSLSSGLPYWVTAMRIINQKNGLLFYGFDSNSVPFQGGTLCVAPPTLRTTMQNSGGLVGPDDCTGTFQLDMNAWAASGADSRLVPGTDVHCQYWYRDPALPGLNKTGLSDALRFTYAP